MYYRGRTDLGLVREDAPNHQETGGPREFRMEYLRVQGILLETGGGDSMECYSVGALTRREKIRSVKINNNNNNNNTNNKENAIQPDLMEEIFKTEDCSFQINLDCSNLT